MKKIKVVISVILIIFLAIGCYVFYTMSQQIEEQRNYYVNFKSARVYNSKYPVLKNGYAVLEGEIESEEKLSHSDCSDYIKRNNNLLVDHEFLEEFNGKWQLAENLLDYVGKAFLSNPKGLYLDVNQIRISGKKFYLEQFDVNPNVGISDCELQDEFKPLYNNGYIWLSGNIDKSEKGDKRVKIISVLNHSYVAAFVKIKNGELAKNFRPVICSGNSESDAYVKLENYLKTK